MKKLLILFLLFTGQYVIAQVQEIRQLQHLLPTITDDKTRADILNRLGWQMHFKSMDSSYFYTEQAQILSEKINYKKGLADVSKTYGSMLIGQNSYLSAKYLNDALELYRQIGDKEGEAMSLMNISNLLYIDRDSTNGKDYLAQAYKIGQSLPKDSVLAVIINNIVYRDFKTPYKKRKILFDKGQAVAKKYNNTRMLAAYKQLHASMLWNNGQDSAAVRDAVATLPMCDSTGNEFTKLNSYMLLCDMLLDSQPDRALYYFRNALMEADRDQFPNMTIIFAQRLYNYYLVKHNDKEALKYAAILLDANSKKESEFKKYDLNVMSFIMKNKDLKLAMEHEKAQTRLIMFFVALLLLIAALLFFVYRSYRHSKKNELLQLQLKEQAEHRNSELQAWNNFNDMLISVLAHDLRQPFSVIIMTADLLKYTKKALSKEDLINILRELNSTAGKSIDLLQGLLCWVKSKKDNFEYKTMPLLVHDVVEEANGLHQYDQQGKNISLVNELPAGMIVHSHQQMLLFICRNLLNNATKYSPANGVIRVYTYALGNEIVIAFQDQGAGMPAVQLDKLFSIASNATSDKGSVQGAGIALCIARDMTLQMNGRLWAESELNKGTTFYLALTQ